jgi:hypothetical protein
MLRLNLPVVERVPAERTRATSTRLEPLEQTTSVEQVLTCLTSLVRQLTVTTHDTVANGALSLSLDSAIDVSFERRQRINQTAVEDVDGAERSPEPRLPLQLIDRNAVQAFNVCIGKREGCGQRDAHAHRLLIHEIRCSDFARARCYLNSKGRVRVRVGLFL